MFDVASIRTQSKKLLAKQAHAMDKSAAAIGGRSVSTAQSTKTITNRSGRGRAGWKYRCWKTSNGTACEVTNSVKYMAYQEHGTGVAGPKRAPYYITPKRGKFLRFVTSSGQLVFARRVKHFGVHPRLIGKAAVFGRQAPFYGQDHSLNLATIEREIQHVTR